MRSVRYLKQRDLYSCGAIAALNAMKWSGFRVSYRKHFKKVSRLCKTNKDGTYIKDIYKALKSMRFRVKYEDEFTAQDLLVHLWNGGSLILGLDWKTKSDRRYMPHVVFVYFDGKEIVATNIQGSSPHVVVPEKLLNRRSQWHGYRMTTSEVIYVSKQAVKT